MALCERKLTRAIVVLALVVASSSFMSQAASFSGSSGSASSSGSSYTRTGGGARRVPPEIESAIRVQTSESNIKVKNINQQLLVGNRKVVQIYRSGQTPDDSSTATGNKKSQTPPPSSANSRSGGASGSGSANEYAKPGSSGKKVEPEKRIVYEFLGIPFARPPLNSLRFQFPQRMSSLLPSDTYNATYFRPSCYQEYDTTFPEFPGSEMWNPPHGVSEDCLYFNIWVPVTHEQDDVLYGLETLGNLNSEQNINYRPDGFTIGSRALKASLFWIYGGSFSSGSANLNITDGTLLAALENVIVVTFNYRTGPFGFLYLNNSIAPGNAGLADQTMVVEWFRENYMRFFGADENAICLFGESVGAMSLHYLMLTNKAHMFKRLIFQSSSSPDLTYRPPSDAYRISLRLAERLNCLIVNEINSTTTANQTIYDLPDETPLNLRQTRYRPGAIPPGSITYGQLASLDEFNAEIVKCLRNAPAANLSLAQYDIDYVNDYLKMQFIPTIDYFGLIKYDPNDIDFSNPPPDIRARLNHDVLVGINKDEGTYFTFYLYNTVYFELKGFLSPNNTRYDNAFVYERLKEAFRTRLPDAVDEDRHLIVQSIQYRSNPNLRHNIVSLTLKRRPQDATLIKASARVDEHFYQQYVYCLSELYKTRNPSLIPNNPNNPTNDGRNLFDLDKNYENAPHLAWNKFNKIIGDYVFSCPTIKLASNYSMLYPNRTFFYKFNKRSLNNPWPPWTGVLHGYEIEYIFGVPWLQESSFDQDDRRVSRRIISYWANFAKHGRLYSEMDLTQRRYLVQFSSNTATYNEQLNTEEDEDAEYELFNRVYENCGFMNKLNRYETYATKYEMCMNVQDKVITNSAVSRHHFSSILFSFISSFSFSFMLFFIFFSRGSFLL